MTSFHFYLLPKTKKSILFFLEMNNVKSKSDKSNTFYALVLQWKPKKTFKYFKHIPDKQPVEYSHKSVEHHKNK